MPHHKIEINIFWTENRHDDCLKGAHEVCYLSLDWIEHKSLASIIRTTVQVLLTIAEQFCCLASQRNADLAPEN